MLPFLFEDLFSTAKSLMGLIIKQDVLNCIINSRQLQKFDFTKKENFLPLKFMTIGFAAERGIMELRRKDVLSQDVINRFMKDCCLIIIGILQKIFERSLNRSSFLEATGCISPESILLKEKADFQHEICTSSKSFLLAYHFK